MTTADARPMTPEEHARGWYALGCDCPHPHGMPWKASVLSALRRAGRGKELCPAAGGLAVRLEYLEVLDGSPDG